MVFDWMREMPEFKIVDITDYVLVVIQLKHVTHALAARSQSEKRTFLALSLDQSAVSLIRE